MKWENKNKKKGKRVLPVFGERNPAKERIKNDKTLRWSQVWIGERERKLENFWKKLFWKSQDPCFKKPDSRCSIGRKTGLINRTRQRLTKIFKKDFDWSKNRLDQSNIWKNIFLEKITWFLKIHLKTLKIRNKNAWEWDEMLFQNTSFKP